MSKTNENPLVNEFNQDQEQEEEIKRVSLKIIDGGKQPPLDGNWLKDLETGTVFLVRLKNNLNDFNLGLFRIEEKTEKSVILRTPSVQQSIYVIPQVFCRMYDLYETLAVVSDKDILELKDSLEQQQQEPSEEGKDNGQSDRPKGDS